MFVSSKFSGEVVVAVPGSLLGEPRIYTRPAVALGQTPPRLLLWINFIGTQPHPFVHVRSGAAFVAPAGLGL